jgi:rhodanese-related sulfurtransferase
MYCHCRIKVRYDGESKAPGAQAGMLLHISVPTPMPEFRQRWARQSFNPRYVMSLDNLLLGLIILYLAWRVLSSLVVRRRLPALLKQGAQVVDVRSLAEFSSGHAAGSVNIPLPEIGERARELDKDLPVIVCCASGTRSALAARRLRGQGFKNVVNAGSWRSLRNPPA